MKSYRIFGLCRKCNEVIFYVSKEIEATCDTNKIIINLILKDKSMYIDIRIKLKIFLH